MADSSCPMMLASQDAGPELLSIAFGLWAVAILAVGLRFHSRRVVHMGYWHDDWAIVVALVISGAYMFVIVFAYVNGSLGRHIACVPAEKRLDTAEFFLKVLLAWSFLYIFIMAAVKYSVLLFLLRMFRVYDFKLWFWISWVVVSIWTVGTLLATGLQCRPLSAFWMRNRSPNLELSCQAKDTATFFIATAVPHIAIDTALLVLPLPWILRLNLAGSLRVCLIGVFGGGYAVIAVSCYRVFLLVDANTDSKQIDITYSFVEAIKWTTVECNIAVLCACLPSMAPLVRQAMQLFNGQSGSIKQGRSPWRKKREQQDHSHCILQSKTYSVHTIDDDSWPSHQTYRTGVQAGV